MVRDALLTTGQRNKVNVCLLTVGRRVADLVMLLAPLRPLASVAALSMWWLSEAQDGNTHYPHMVHRPCRRRNNHSPVQGNNKFGRGGTLRCVTCRKRKIKVSTLQFPFLNPISNGT